MVLVAGATGLVGQEICNVLRTQGSLVRALVRETSAPEKREQLRRIGAEQITGDLKAPETLAQACAGVKTVISTASATLSQQEGDTIESVDHDGQLALVDAARAAGVQQFIYVSFRDNPDLQSPLRIAKSAVEERLREGSMDYTILQASYFMEVWLSPALGFDYPSGKVTVFGDGSSPISWIASGDVAKCAAACAHEPRTRRKTLEIGGPEALSPREVIGRFVDAGWGPFETTAVPEAHLRGAFEQAEDPMQRTFAALQLQYALGDAIDIAPMLGLLPLSLTSVSEYARRMKAGAGTAA